MNPHSQLHRRTPVQARSCSVARNAGVAITLVAAALLLAAHPAHAEVLPGHRVTLQNNEHALGISLSAPFWGASGFAYRKYFGNAFVQANLLPLVADRGDFIAVLFGAQYGHYLVVWTQGSGTSVLPSTTALRALAGAWTFFERDASAALNAAPISPTSPGSVSGGSTTPTEVKVSNTTGIGAGIGFEFGAVMRSGFSFSADLMFTAAWDNDGFESLVPQPYFSLLYSW